MTENSITTGEAQRLCKDVMLEAAQWAAERFAKKTEVCRVCGGRDHQCDDNVVESSVNKDKELHARIYAQDERIQFLQGEVYGLQRDRDMFRQAALESKSLLEKAKADFHELEIRQSDEIKKLRRKNFALEEQSIHDAETINERDSQIAALTRERDSYKTAYEQAMGWLNREKDNTMAGVNQLRSEVERLRVQLAGCGVAAQGGTDPDKGQVAKEGDYGWSPAYQDTLDLRRRYDELLKEKERILEDYSGVVAEHGKLKDVTGELDKEVKRLRERCIAVNDEWRSRHELAKTEWMARLETTERASGGRFLVIEAAIKKLGLERLHYKDYDELVRVIEGDAPHVADLHGHV